jgi:hypothetical protein
VATDRSEEDFPRLVHDGEDVSHVTHAFRTAAVSGSTAGVATVR